MRTSLILSHVALASAERSGQYFDDMRAAPQRWAWGGRCGTLYASLEGFAERIGDPHERHLTDGAGKVSAIWYFDTPRGLVQVSDYWWNPPTQLSIRAADRRALRWFLRWCRINNFQADGSTGK